jgi:UDP-2,3-diacylglucosamine hydrolase
MKRGLVISDLHLFSPRSEGSCLMAGVMAEALNVDVLVLNGDIFDFRWSCLPDQSTTISAAIDWLVALMDGFQGESIHYILGNHDCINAFTSRLDDLTLRNPAFSCHELRLILNRKLFLHGDCANRKMDEQALKKYRRAWSNHRQRGNLGRALYNIADSTGLSRRFHEQHFPVDATVSRVVHHLDHVLPAWREDIDDCFFGHTHRPFADHSRDGVLFHNTGSGIRGMGFQPLAFSP